MMNIIHISYSLDGAYFAETFCGRFYLFQIKNHEDDSLLK
jgi:hypothetical protein